MDARPGHLLGQGAQRGAEVEPLGIAQLLHRRAHHGQEHLHGRLRRLDRLARAAIRCKPAGEGGWSAPMTADVANLQPTRVLLRC